MTNKESKLHITAKMRRKQAYIKDLNRAECKCGLPLRQFIFFDPATHNFREEWKHITWKQGVPFVVTGIECKKADPSPQKESLEG